ncbi:hypothetical protein H0I31_01100 [Tenacibaculum sp. AHE15PA]|uniref:hypothetical protein n=1 Tax=unclassified Tenacibaculum TaxID=2635139 RepID=UPI001C4E3742|nr:MULTISPECIES: hypothetical protein [unclassified Tenacibaculum]QXP74744.1 hypothetical protein H0I30_06360 [Tenacibaculum sp. AHE14PA]QXP76255.1 hypothetical protein H0I31_01100 [Tenacibaculum sp. AHE15PA]
MKQHILKVGIVMGLLLLIGTFTSCDKTRKSNTQELGNIAKKEETVNKINLNSRKPIVFIAGYDKSDSKFYDSARVYFKDKKYRVINEEYSLEEIITWMNKNATENPYGDIHIVNYSTPFKGMHLETVVNGEKITTESLQKSISKGNLPTLKKGININTKIVFHSNGLGKNEALLNSLKQAFSTDEVPQVAASPYFNIFGGEFTNHYLAAPYYVFYPTANSPGKVDLSKEIAKKYPKERDIDWFAALTNERERYIGEPYTKQFSVPVSLEVDYLHSDEEIPTFVMQEELMDFIANDEDLMKKMNKLNIPVEKFRWTYKIKDSKLLIKGKTSVLCVLKPLTKPFGDLEHIKPDTNNKRLYAMK